MYLFSCGYFLLKVVVCVMFFSGIFILYSVLKDECVLMMFSECYYVKVVYEKCYFYWKDKV